MSRPLKGFFKPKNPQKYIGDANNIVFRSQLELRFMMILDSNPDIIQWASEETHVIYYDPVQRKNRRYFPDFVIKNNKNQTFMIEIKPFKETQQPILKEGKNKKSYLNEFKVFTTNQSKWQSAEEFCKDRKWKFQIITERDFGINYGN